MHDQASLFGIDRMSIGLLNTNGIPMGLTGSLENGGGCGMYEIRGVSTSEIAEGQPEIKTLSGNSGRVKSSLIFENNEAPNGVIKGIIYDMALAAAVRALKVRHMGAMSLLLEGARKGVFKDIGAIVTGKGVTHTPGKKGTIYWGYYIPNMVFAPLLTGPMPQKEGIEIEFFTTVNGSDTHLWGEALSSDTDGSDYAHMIRFTSPYPVTMETIVGDGTKTVWTLSKTPVGSDAATPQIAWVYNATDKAMEVTTTNYTINPATKALTFLTGHIPAEGDVYCIPYCYVD